VRKYGDYRQYATKRQTAGIKIYSQVKNQHYCHSGSTRWTNSREIWHEKFPLGAKIWCLYVCFYRQDAVKRETAGIKLTHGPKMSIFAPQGWLVAPIHVKLGKADGH